MQTILHQLVPKPPNSRVTWSHKLKKRRSDGGRNSKMGGRSST